MLKKDWFKIGIFLLAVILVLSACDGTSSNGVSDGYGGVDLVIQGSLPTAVAAGRTATNSAVLSVTSVAGTEIGQLTLVDARLNIYQIELEQELDEVDSVDENTQKLEIEYTGPFVVDVLKDTIEPAIPYIEILPGTYDEIKLKLASIEGDEVDDDGNPLIAPGDPLYENSIVLIGTYSGIIDTEGTATNIPFTATFAIDEEFLLGGTEGIILEEGVINPIIVAFRMARWFHFHNPETNSDSLEFSDITPTLGEITINETENSTIWEVIKENINGSAEFGKDSDEDGELDSDEDDDTEDDDDF